MLDVEAYLRRIDDVGPLEPTVATLRRLHRAHMEAVPFENLDIHAGRPLALTEAGLFAKIVERRRGGFCYELNGLFARLLHALGFDVTLLSARVADDAGGFGPEFDHLLLLVRLQERWLADVGFGSSFHEPLRLDDPGAQVQAYGTYRVLPGDNHWTYLELDADRGWQARYIFTLTPRHLADFEPSCIAKQSSPFWTNRRICTRATAEGRATLSDGRLIVTRDGAREERPLADEAEQTAVLRERFGVEL